MMAVSANEEKGFISLLGTYPKTFDMLFGSSSYSFKDFR